MRLSSVAITGVVVAAAGFGVYELGKGASNSAREVSTIAIGIPQQASIAVANANLAAAVSAATAYKSEHGDYAGLTTAALDAYNAALSVSVVRADAVGYCIQTTVATATVSIRGPTGTAVVGPC